MTGRRRGVFGRGIATVLYRPFRAHFMVIGFDPGLRFTAPWADICRPFGAVVRARGGRYEGGRAQCWRVEVFGGLIPMNRDTLPVQTWFGGDKHRQDLLDGGAGDRRRGFSTLRAVAFGWRECILCPSG